MLEITAALQGCRRYRCSDGPSHQRSVLGLLVSAAFECRIAAALEDSLITYAWVILSGALPGIPALIGLEQPDSTHACYMESNNEDHCGGERLPLFCSVEAAVLQRWSCWPVQR